MTWHANFQSPNSRTYEIKCDPNVGYYLYVYEEGQCVSDFLQDTFEIAVDVAYEDFDVPKGAWEPKSLKEQISERLTD